MYWGYFPLIFTAGIIETILIERIIDFWNRDLSENEQDPVYIYKFIWTARLNMAFSLKKICTHVSSKGGEITSRDCCRVDVES